MILRRKNWLGETEKGQHERRIKALEAHINDIEVRLDERVNYLMSQLAKVTPNAETAEEG